MDVLFHFRAVAISLVAVGLTIGFSRAEALDKERKAYAAEWVKICMSTGRPSTRIRFTKHEIEAINWLQAYSAAERFAASVVLGEANTRSLSVYLKRHCTCVANAIATAKPDLGALTKNALVDKALKTCGIERQ